MPGQLETPSKELLDLETATVLKRGRDPTNQIMTEQEARAYQAGEIDREVVRPTLRPITTGPYATATPDQAVAQPQQVPAYQPPQPQVQPAQVAGPALLSNQQVPVTPTDSAPVRKRINQLYGQMKSAQEERDVFANQVASLEEKIARLEQSTPARQPEPVFTLENPYAPAPRPNNPAGQEFISRDDFSKAMSQLTQAITRQNTLVDAQRSSRAEVDRDFAQHLSDPEFLANYETILQHDFRNDPNGPMKAAIMARGMLADSPGQIRTATGASADVARRQALGSIGPTVAEGGSAPQSDRVSRYHAAIEYAKQTQREEDWARALRIKNGVE